MDGMSGCATLPPATSAEPSPPKGGTVALVGAGPGDPDLLTVRAQRLLGQAEVVFHDELVSDAILELLPSDVERVPVGKVKGRHSWTQDRINRALVDAARSGRRVVRLKGGDPSLFARAGEEIDYLRRHGIAAELVPGVTAALGCAASAGFPLTDRRHASTVVVVGGHAREGDAPPDWRRIAGPRRTIVVYMGLSNAGAIAAGLIGAGHDPATPAALVANATRANQRIATGRLAELGTIAARHAEDDPALIVIGDVVRLGPDWAPLEPAWTAAW
ncbi:MAG: uroporphyrinogen-III C-methyltransferase [Alphaproteobacteria bacterium]|nr:uroporphyrinogen-III C-methyltransferase [Alphaproteobacteria bacterium]